MSQLPAGTIGDAVGVLIFTFICLFTNILLVWLYWISHERLNYVALIAYFALICTISSIIQQIYNYTLWNDLLWAQLYHIKANYKNADVIFNNGNFGFMRVLAVIRLFCYIMESSYLLSYSIQVTLTVYGFWITRRTTERMFSVAGKLAPLFLAVITIGLLQTPPVQSSFLVYMIVANAQSVTSCAVSIILISIVLWKYIDMKLSWRHLKTTQRSKNSEIHFWSSNSSKARSSVTQVNTAQRGVFDDNWLVFRLSVAVVLVSAFIVASVVTHLPQRDDVARDAQADEPDLGPGRARSNIIGYIFGVTPGLAIWIVFGLTKNFRQIMYEKLIRKKLVKGSEPASPPHVPLASAPDTSRPNLARFATDVELQLDDLGRSAKRRMSPDSMDAPLLVYDPLASPTRSDRSVPGGGRISLK
ncbi:hypothetical protein F5X99DRAFT_412241 [Biscogniauxia marginata]|nr:hypothetical protein F5X99DRAFT_412241 [Biscogniauxia marginata]